MPALSLPLRCAALSLFALLLAACATPPAAPPALRPAAPATLLVTGAASYRERIALPSQAQLVVQLRDLHGAPGVLALQRTVLEGRQVPLAFRLSVPRAALAPGHRYGLRAAIVMDSVPAWASDEVELPLGGDDTTVPTLLLRATEQQNFASRLRCGARDGEVVATDSGARLTLGSEVFEMRQVRAASGAKFEDLADPSTWFWGKGRSATFMLRGKKQPPCNVQPPSTLLLRASGNEPGWTLRIDKGELRFLTQDGAAPVTVPFAVLPQGVNGASYLADTGEGLLAVAERSKLCQDDMSGLPFPATVNVAFRGREYRGCGGSTADLLRDTRWVVEAIDGEPLHAQAKVLLEFKGDSQVAGLAPCNRFHGRYALKGEGLQISQVAATRRACAPALMKQEHALLGLLGAVQGLGFRSDGALVLRAPGQRTLLARRE